MTEPQLQPLGINILEDNSSFDDFKHSTTATNRPQLSRRKQKRNISAPKKMPDFVVDYNKPIPDYNGLRDPHLHYHFYNKKLRKLLRKNGLLTKNGEVIEKKSCLNEIETFKQSQVYKDLRYKPFERGTLILSTKLPEIKQVPLSSFPKPQQPRSAQTRLYERKRPEREFSPVAPNKLSSLDTSAISNGYKKLNFLKAPQRERLYSKTPIQSRSQRDEQTSALNKSAEIEGPRKVKMGYHFPTKYKKQLKPLSKDELQAIFERYKKKLNDSSIVTEVPETEEGASLDAKQDKDKGKDKKKKEQTESENHHPRSKSTFEVEKREIKVPLKTDYVHQSYGQSSSASRDIANARSSARSSAQGNQRKEETDKLNTNINNQNQESEALVNKTGENLVNDQKKSGQKSKFSGDKNLKTEIKQKDKKEGKKS